MVHKGKPITDSRISAVLFRMIELCWNVSTMRFARKGNVAIFECIAGSSLVKDAFIGMS